MTAKSSVLTWEYFSVINFFYSGMGATLYWTQEIIGTLHTVISQIKWQLGTNAPIRILDVPCGDMAWMSRFLKTRNDIDYTGIDIVPEIIEHHRESYKNFGWKFKHLDILSIKEIDSYDIIICRTLLQHLYFVDGQKLFKLFSDSGSRLLITTSFYRKDVNEELVISADNTGRFRKLNLEIPPFSLVPPLCIVRDGPPDAFEGWDHFLGIWKLPLRRIKRCKTPVPMLLDKTEQKILFILVPTGLYIDFVSTDPNTAFVTTGPHICFSNFCHFHVIYFRLILYQCISCIVFLDFQCSADPWLTNTM